MYKLAAALAATAMLVACSPKAATVNGPGNATGPGVTDQVIKLGVLSDRTGAFAGSAKSVEQGRQLFWNDHGAVCGRRVEFVVKDHGYNAQNAVTAYTQLRGEVLALDELLGSPMIAALLPDIEADQMLTMAVSWSSSLLANPYVVLTGKTYDVEMINGIHWLTKYKQLAKGDRVGHIFLEGDYGENAAAGSRAAAGEYGFQLLEHKIKPTDTDLTGQLTALRGAGAKFVLLTTTPPQTASAVSVAEASGFDATFLASNPGHSPALLAGPARAALEKRLFVATSTAPFSSENAGPADVRTKFLAKHGDQQKSAYVMYGYAQGEIMAKILDAACKKGELTRAGLRAAFESLDDVRTNGLVAPLNYSKPGQIPAREVFLARPDAGADGGLAQLEGLFAAPLATSYQPEN